jgi:hypothetical protein
MDHNRHVPESGAEAPDKQQTLVSIEAGRNLRGIDNFLWRSSGDTPLVQRIGNCLFGLGFLLGGIFLISFLRRADSAFLAIIVGILSFAVIAVGVRVIMIGCKRRKR